METNDIMYNDSYLKWNSSGWFFIESFAILRKYIYIAFTTFLSLANFFNIINIEIIIWE